MAANEWLLETDAADGEVLTVGSTGDIELARTIRDEIDPDLEIKFGGPTTPTRNARIRTFRKPRNGWATALDFDEGGDEMVIERYRETRDWADPLVLEP